MKRQWIVGLVLAALLCAPRAASAQNGAFIDLQTYFGCYTDADVDGCFKFTAELRRWSDESWDTHTALHLFDYTSTYAGGLNFKPYFFFYAIPENQGDNFWEGFDTRTFYGPWMGATAATALPETMILGFTKTSCERDWWNCPEADVQRVRVEFETVVTPEPSTMVLLASGLVGLGLLRRRHASYRKPSA